MFYKNAVFVLDADVLIISTAGHPRFMLM